MLNGTPDHLKTNKPSPKQLLRNERSHEQNEKLNRRVNKIAAVIIPILILCLFGWATWVNVGLIAVEYCLRSQYEPDLSSSAIPRRAGSGIAILVINFVLLLPTLMYYMRTIQVVRTDPGIVPSSYLDGQKEGQAREKVEAEVETHDGNAYLDRGSILGGSVPAPAGIELFYTRPIFECDLDGLPRWCTKCKNWKPDRSNHCSELERCVFKMDHYCPWAGGTVTETSFKFFLQFCVTAAMYCLFCVVTCAWYAGTRNDDGQTANVYVNNVYALIAVAFLFTIFSGGIFATSSQLAWSNSTMVDNLARKSRLTHFAIRITYDEIMRYTHLTRISYPLDRPEVPRHHFMVIELPQGDNPYDLGSRLENYKMIMGQNVWDWFSPLKYSPCCNHPRGRSVEEVREYGLVMYPHGPALEKTKALAVASAPPLPDAAAVPATTGVDD